MVRSNVVFTGNSMTKLWDTIYNELLTHENKQTSRDGDIHSEIINASVILKDPTRNICQSDIRNMSIRYAVGEMLWYMSGNPSLKEIQKFTPGWDRMSDDNETVNSNYGYCCMYKFGFDQIDYVIELLKNSPNTRQAIIHIKEPRDTIANPTKDLNCTLSVQYLIRDDKLTSIVTMRSCDIWFGLPYDMFWWGNIQTYISMGLGCPLGDLIFNIGSLHLYERDAHKTENMGSEGHS